MDGVLRNATEALLHESVASAAPVSGGDVAEAWRVDLVDGRTVFVKHQASAPKQAMTTEAAGLAWLRAPGVVSVPEVLAVSDDEPNLLVLAWIDVGSARPTDQDGEAFGRQLAALHRAGAPAFGREDGRPTGSLGVDNTLCRTWPEFFATRRLLPLAARSGPLISTEARMSLRRLTEHLSTFPGSDEVPARLHGDLWAGNRVRAADGTSWLIDPQAHGGHRESDLAMMRLFGGFSESVFAAYEEVFPLAEGWKGRVDLHQIPPLLVHAMKFGGSYVAAAEQAILRAAPPPPRRTAKPSA